MTLTERLSNQGLKEEGRIVVRIPLKGSVYIEGVYQAKKH